MKKQTTFYHNGKPYMIERGKIYIDFGLLYKIVRREDENLFKLREYVIAKSGIAYPVKGEEGVRYLTLSETAELIELDSNTFYTLRNKIKR